MSDFNILQPNQMDTVSFMPPYVVKVEYVEENESETLPCRLCFKAFSNNVALMNHCRNEHLEALESGMDISKWNVKSEIAKTITQVKPTATRRVATINTDEEEQRKEEFLSSLRPASLVSLASEDVSYIIIKSEDAQSINDKDKKGDEKGNKGDKSKRAYLRREKELAPITGPFECLQPSTVVEDGTCHQIFFSCCEYSAHFRDEHTKRHKGQRCQVCEKPLLPGVADDPESLFSCQICGQPHDNNKSLQDHINTEHRKLRPFACSVCHKRFTQQGGLMQHMRMHTGERPFPCTFCPKAFTQKSGLEQHLRTHTKVKPYRCVVCNKTFCQSIHLKQHMRIHTNLSPFQCGICEKRFKQSSHLNYHLRSHSDGMITDEQRVKLAMLLGSADGSGLYSLDSPDGAMVGAEDGAEHVVEYVEDGVECQLEEDNVAGWCVKIQDM